MNRYFVTGIGTDVGKTIASAILTEALEADYWKPIQAGDLQNSDTHKVKELISNNKSVFHPNSYALNTPMSPHAAAEIDGMKIEAGRITEPITQNDLIIEGAGGILVPVNSSETVIDLIQASYKVIVVSRHYLGSINHTLLTVEALKRRNLNCFGIIFNGNENSSTEEIILKMTGLKMIGRIKEETSFSKSKIREYAGSFREIIKKLNDE